MNQIFAKYENAITRNEYQNFQPISTSNLNLVNKKTTFKIDIGDNFHNPFFDYYMSGKLVQRDNGHDYDDNAEIELEDNFAVKLWSKAEAKKHNKLLDEIEYVGVASTIKGTVSYSLDGNGPTINSGFQSNYRKGGGYFSVLGKLSNFGLGYFKDVKIPIYKAGYEITFTRNDDDDAIFLTKPSIPKGKVIIEEFLIRVPIIEYEDTAKIQLINELKELSLKEQYLFRFRSWQCIQHRNIIGKTLSVDVTNIYRNIHNPLFGIVGFQIDRLTNQLKNNSVFDHCNVKNLWFEVNKKRYPEELIDLDWSKNKYAIAYDMLTHYKKVFNKSHEELPLIYADPNDFKSARALYVIDLTRQPINISESRNNILLHVDFNEAVPKDTICYICMVSSSEFIYDIINNTIKENI